MDVVIRGPIGGAVGVAICTAGGARAFCETSNVELRGPAGVAAIPKHNK